LTHRRTGLQQLQEIFKVGREQADGHQLIEGGSKELSNALYVIWRITIAAGFAVIIGVVKGAFQTRGQTENSSGYSANEGSTLTPTLADERSEKSAAKGLNAPPR
jgi:hypothetical protein